MKVKFTGGRELEAALKGLDISTARKRGIAKRALQRAAVPIKDEWVRGVDVDKGVLRRSIDVGDRALTRGVRKFRRGSDIVEQYVGINLREDPVRLSIYPYIEEFGDKDQAANPAGRNAFETQKQQSMDMIGDALWAEISKAARKAK